MADSAVTRNVFLDTEVYDRHVHGYTEGNLERVSQLSALTDVKLYMTTITQNEVRAHLQKEAKKTVANIKSIKRLPKIAKKHIPAGTMHEVAEAAILQELNEEFDKFLKDSKIEILTLKDVKADEVMEMYFSTQAPFGDEDKKSEFPDAMAFLALKAWCSKEDEQMYVVSNDKDWKRACKDREDLLHVQLLDELLELFQDSIIVTQLKEAFVASRQVIEDLVLAEAEDFEYYVSDDYIGEPEYEEVVIEEVDFVDYHVVEINNGSAEISIYCRFSIRTTISGYDPKSGLTGEDAMMFTRKMYAEVSDEFYRTITLSVTYDVEDPEDVSFDSVSMTKGIVEIEVDPSELQTEEEERDYDEYDGEYDAEEPS